MRLLQRKLDDGGCEETGDLEQGFGTGGCEETGAADLTMRVDISSSRIYHALISGGERAWQEQ